MIRVIVDIFSGRPNPVWEVDEVTAQDLLRQVEPMRDIVGGLNIGSGRLGFRGLVIEKAGRGEILRAHEFPQTLRVSGEDPRGVELALRLLSTLDQPRAEPHGNLPAGFAAPSPADLRRLIEQDAVGFVGSGSPSGGGVFGHSGAPVLGTDASSWTTAPQGSCQKDLGAFNPGFWNVARVQANNNCYNYATNRRTDTFAQPGRAAGKQATTMACSNVASGAKVDGILGSSFCLASTSQPRWYVALVVWPGVDYHWYRQQAEGYWGHKPGTNAARNYDNSGNVITNPQTANRGVYTDFCGYFFVGSGAQIA